MFGSWGGRARKRDLWKSRMDEDGAIDGKWVIFTYEVVERTPLRVGIS